MSPLSEPLLSHHGADSTSFVPVWVLDSCTLTVTLCYAAHAAHLWVVGADFDGFCEPCGRAAVGLHAACAAMDTSGLVLYVVTLGGGGWTAVSQGAHALGHWTIAAIVSRCAGHSVDGTSPCRDLRTIRRWGFVGVQLAVSLLYCGGVRPAKQSSATRTVVAASFLVLAILAYAELVACRWLLPIGGHLVYDLVLWGAVLATHATEEVTDRRR